MSKHHISTVAVALMLGLVSPATTLKADESATTASTAVSEAFGNTIRSTYPDGRTAELWLTSDGAYTAEGRRHDPSSGHWKVKDSKLCLKQSRPFAAPFSYCVALPSAGMSSGWTGKAYTGEAIQIQLIKGQVRGGA
jgi:hypothetical protein